MDFGSLSRGQAVGLLLCVGVVVSSVAAAVFVATAVTDGMDDSPAVSVSGDVVGWMTADTTTSADSGIRAVQATPESTETGDPSPTPTRTPSSTAGTQTPNRTPTRTPTPTSTPTTTRTPNETTTPTSTPNETQSSSPSSTPPPVESPTPTRTPSSTPGRTQSRTTPSTPTTTPAGPPRPRRSTGTSGIGGSRNDSSRDAGATGGGNGSAVRDGASWSDDSQVVSTSRRALPSRAHPNATVVVSFDDVPVSTISFDGTAYGNATVATLEALPPDVSPPAGERLSLLRISVPEGFSDDRVTMTVGVDARRLAVAGISPDAVQITRRNPATGEWERLETSVVRESEEVVVYRTVTSKFSMFAIQSEATRTGGPGRWGANVTVTPFTGTGEADSVSAFVGAAGGTGDTVVVVLLGLVAVGTTFVAIGVRERDGVDFSRL